MKAFPSFAKLPIGNNEYVDAPVMGMDLRDYFAAKAMQGLLASPRNPSGLGVDVTDKLISDLSYKMADAMMEARNNGK